MTGRLEGKTALITGGASGIGAAMARCFSREGARVYIADRERKAGERTAAQLSATFVELDVTDEQGWRRTLDDIVNVDGHLDILCNNAGMISNQTIADTDLTQWERVMAVNVTGAMLGCRSAIEAMLRASPGRTGSIINVGSTTSFQGLAFDAAYTTSKTAILGLTRSVAAWCAQEKLPIRCNSLHPGTTLTAMLQGQIDQWPELREKFNAMSPTGRMAAPDEIANLALFLASDESSYCTGGAFVADGGLTATHPTM